MSQMCKNISIIAPALFRRLIPIIGLSTCLLQVNGQTVEEKFNRSRQAIAQEKLYVHTDRELYLTGETIGVKVYAVDGGLHRPTDLSSVAYVEIMADGGVPAVQVKISLADGMGAGSIFLPATLSSGNYILRAYTRWMQNFDSDFFFQKTISIVNTFIQLDAPINEKGNIVAQFFPEGGTWVGGIEGKVAFKVSDNRGVGIRFRGSLINEKNDTLLHFQPDKFGMGNFVITPIASSSYRAVISASNERKVFDLPQVQTSGYSMKVVENEGQLKVELRASAGLMAGTALLFAHARQIVVKAVQVALIAPVTTVDINIGELPEGISHITLFNAAQQPVCERLYFKKPVNTLAVQAATDKVQYGLRKEVKLDISSSQESSLSVAVYRLDSLSRPASSGILEYLWLSSDLKGFIESPEYYFGTDAGAGAAADNLMLTQGWRRFKWSDVLSVPLPPQVVPEHRGHLIRGVVKNSAGRPMPGILTYLASPDKIISTYSARSDKNGNVTYVVRNMYGPRRLVTYADSAAHVELGSPFSSAVTTWPVPSFSLSPGTEKDLLARSIWMQARDIYFEDKIKPVRFDSTSFYGQADETYFLDDYTRFPVMEEILREYVPGVMVRKHRDGFHFVLINDVTKKLIQESPTVLIDGVPIFDINKVMAFDPLRVHKLEVINRKYYHGSSMFSGLVSFTTYSGDLAGYPLDENYVSINYDGLNLEREVYSPNYQNNPQANLPDQRSLLYWNADVSGSKESTPLRFYTSDLEGRYIVIAEGISFDGKAGRTAYQFTVRK